MQVTHVSVAHQERGLLMAQTVLGMVRTPLSKAAANTAKERKKWNRKKNRKRLTDNHEFPQYAAFIASQTSEQSCYSDDVKRPMCSS